MVKHRRWSDKQESEPTPKEDIESISKQENTPLKIETDLKSLLLSGTKYIYIVAAAALFSGIFTPLTIGAEFESVITGILSILLGLGGGIVLFLGIKYQKSTKLLVIAGLGMMIVSLILILEIAHLIF